MGYCNKLDVVFAAYEAATVRRGEGAPQGDDAIAAVLDEAKRQYLKSRADNLPYLRDFDHSKAPRPSRRNPPRPEPYTQPNRAGLRAALSVQTLCYEVPPNSPEPALVTHLEGKRAVYKRGDTWWYSFLFAERRIQESAKTHSKTVAKKAEQARRRELEERFNALKDRRRDRVRSVAEACAPYAASYKANHAGSSVRWVSQTLEPVKRILGSLLVFPTSPRTASEPISTSARARASAPGASTWRWRT